MSIYFEELRSVDQITGMNTLGGMIVLIDERR